MTSIEKWNSIMQKRVDRAEVLYNAGMTEASKALVCEIQGGGCPVCGKPWIKKKFRLLDDSGDGVYFAPDCDCYPICPFCREALYEEFLSDRLKNTHWMCTNCGWQLLQKTGGNLYQRHGREYEVSIFNRMTRREKIRAFAEVLPWD